MPWRSPGKRELGNLCDWSGGMIDPIKVQEAQKRDRAELAYASRRVKAADALLWFNEYAPPEKHIAAVLRGGPTLVASSTPNAALALWYISQTSVKRRLGKESVRPCRYRW